MMVNLIKNTVCTTRTQLVHNPRIRFAVNKQKQMVNGSQTLTKQIGKLLTSEVLV